jgi:hypothetical protein
MPQPDVSAKANTPSGDVIREFNDRGTLWLLEDHVHLRSLIQIVEPELAERLNTDRAERVNRSLIPEDLQKVELIWASAKGSKFREKKELVIMGESMAQWVERKARSEGKVEGGNEVAHAFVLRLGSKRFGAPDAQTMARLAAISKIEQLERLADRLLEAESWQELFA